MQEPPITPDLIAAHGLKLQEEDAEMEEAED